MKPIAAPVRQPPLVTQVADRFRSLIDDGTWAVGSRIPGENLLAAELGVSRGTVREALRALSLAGLLDPKVGDGTYVRTKDELFAILDRDPISGRLDDVLDVRVILEAAAARRAAANASDEHIRALRSVLSERKNAHDRGDRAGYVAADALFHHSIVIACGNPLLARLYEAISQTMAESIDQTAILPEDPRIERLHDDLAQAIADHDQEAAERITVTLIDEVRIQSSAAEETR